MKLFLDNPTFKLLVSLLILSPFDNCDSSYYGFSETTLHPLTKAFNSAARFFSDTHEFFCLTPTFIFLHWLPLKKRSVSKICIFMFKIKNNHSPTYLTDFFKLLPRKRLKSTCFHFSKIPSNSNYAKLALFY